MCSNLSRISPLELTLRQVCSVLSEICRLEPFSRQMCSDLNRICRLEPASRQMCSNLNRICHLERLCPYNCVKEKSHSHPHDTIILDQIGRASCRERVYVQVRRGVV